MARLISFTIAASDGHGNQPAWQSGAAEEVHYGPADTGGVGDEGDGASSQLRARYPPAHALDDGWVVEVERQTLQVTEGKAPLKEQLVGDEVATSTYFGVLETGDGTGVTHLAEVESEEVFGADDARPVEGLDGSEPFRRIIKIMVGCYLKALRRRSSGKSCSWLSANSQRYS